MNCIITGSHIKVFGKVIHCLAKFGNELHICDSDDGLILRTVNNAMSAYASVVLKEKFFYDYKKVATNDITDSDSLGFHCKISMKVILGVFKSITAIEKSVDKCLINADDTGSKFTIRFQCKLDIIKTYELSCMESEILSTIYSKENCTNRLSLSIKLLGEIFMTFTNKQIEIILNANQDFMVVENRVDEETKRKDTQSQMYTRLKMSSEEFDTYNIGDGETNITFCLKELKGMMQFSEFIQSPVQIFFSSPGKPIIFSLVLNDIFEVDVVLATLESSPPSSPQSQSQSQFEPTNQPLRNRKMQRAETTTIIPDFASTSRVNTSINVKIKNELSRRNNDESMSILSTPSLQERVFSVFDTPSSPPCRSSQFHTLASDSDDGYED
ncbi:Cell cycle checkpoint control protein rad9b [Chamberlinius hualienensis]